MCFGFWVPAVGYCQISVAHSRVRYSTYGPFQALCAKYKTDDWCCHQSTALVFFAPHGSKQKHRDVVRLTLTAGGCSNAHSVNIFHHISNSTHTHTSTSSSFIFKQLTFFFKILFQAHQSHFSVTFSLDMLSQQPLSISWIPTIEDLFPFSLVWPI